MKRRSKYNNRKVKVDGHVFDSKKEAERYGELKSLSKAEKIFDLRIQPKFKLLEGYADKRLGMTKAGKPRKVPPVYYLADFKYFEPGRGWVVEDVKSAITRKNPVYRLKVKMLLSLYKDIDFREI